MTPAFITGIAPTAASSANTSLAERIDALPSSVGLWRFISLLALGGFFELYDLFETGYISTGLLAPVSFTRAVPGYWALPIRLRLLPLPSWGCLLAPACSRPLPTALVVD